MKNGIVELIPIPNTHNHKKIHLTDIGQSLALKTTDRLKKAEKKLMANYQMKNFKHIWR